MTVLATTFDGKLHAAQLAEKYRAGDLHLQKAKIDYAAGNKDADAKAKLLVAWHEAQDILESSSLTPVKSAAATPPANNTGTQPVPQTLSPGTTDTTTKGSANAPKHHHLNAPAIAQFNSFLRSARNAVGFFEHRTVSLF
jgi:hypothetical protein